MFDTIFVQPMLNLLYWLYATVPGHDFGIAVILLTIAVRLFLWPVATKQLHGQKALSAIQPEVNKLKEKYKDKPEKFNAAVMELYKEKEVNPFGSCLLTLVQFPFLIGLFYVFMKFRDPAFAQIAPDAGIITELYPFVREATQGFTATISEINTNFFGLVDLAHPFVPLGILAGAFQFVQTKMLMPKKPTSGTKDMATAMTTQMTYIFPLLTIGISITLPAALPLYWSVTTLFAVGQQYLVMHKDVEVLEEKSETKRSKKGRKNS
jgi:YidC/Oxa1 family membrane protein insertase